MYCRMKVSTTAVSSALSALMVLAGISAAIPAGRAQAPPGNITIRADQPGAAINPSFYGLMTEEINHAYDGGLYAELIRNRIFKDNAPYPEGWWLEPGAGASGSIALDTALPINDALTTSLRWTITSVGSGIGIANEGWWGIPVRPNTTYRASLYARASAGFTSPLTLSIESANGATVHAQAQIPSLDQYWRKYTVTLQTGDLTPSKENRFVISAGATGTVWVNLVSLFPPTYNDTPNGNRIDLMEKMAALKPAFLRFPGGNYLDPGHSLWKITRGPVDDRPGHPGAWSYRSSDGLGLMEFLLWCEDLNMEPLLGVSTGRDWLPASGDIKPLVQDALDQIEYITGDVTTPWGAKRALDGHPEPFPLRYVEIGNEDFFDSLSTYNARFAAFYDAIKARYPHLQVIATRGDVSSRRPDVIDDHIYSSQSGMMRAAHNYDNYDRNRPPVFVGEWATTVGSPTPTLYSALSDAAYLTGLERNADVVIMAAYAPLLVNVNPGASQWGTNMIGYDALTSFGSPSYYMQRMFYNNLGDVVLPLAVTPQAPDAESPRGKIGVGTWNTVSEYRNVSVTQNGNVLYQKDFANGAADWIPDGGTWTIVNGALRQTATITDCRATAGDTTWADYVYTLQARKISGSEGFLIMFHVEDHNNFIWWNIGGWNNSRTTIERARNGSKYEIGQSANVTVQTNRWYDIRIELQGTNIRCYLDGVLVNQAADIGVAGEPIFAAASRDNDTGDVILKVVNVTSSAQQLQLDIPGAGRVISATGEMLTGNPTDVNTVDQPERVAPVPVVVTAPAQPYVHEFPANSVSVLRLKPMPSYGLADAVSACRLAGGLQDATPAEAGRLDAVASGSSAGRVDLPDAAHILRITMGLDT